MGTGPCYCNGSVVEDGRACRRQIQVPRAVPRETSSFAGPSAGPFFNHGENIHAGARAFSVRLNSSSVSFEIAPRWPLQIFQG